MACNINKECMYGGGEHKKEGKIVIVHLRDEFL
jgi:hypothetical protein